MLIWEIFLYEGEFGEKIKAWEHRLLTSRVTYLVEEASWQMDSEGVADVPEMLHRAEKNFKKLLYQLRDAYRESYGHSNAESLFDSTLSSICPLWPFC